ncbi:tRNA(Ile)-lysidine synthase [Parelusimicrobium proximum]|uniref:tRNA lysidine(34) synthetase TilS n=1 Tax=Parelusimicrobium proximum TaxID=3228953 RepID=UPI003D18633C
MKEKEFYAKVWGKIIRESKAMFSKGDHILLGLSGGADSVCLLHFLLFLAPKYKLKITALHLNHKLRAAAPRDEKFVKDLCKRAGVKCIVKKADVAKLAKRENLSIEHAARKARYKAFEEAAKKIKAGKVALAHHLDDDAETILLNILRGTKAKGLLGIPERRPLTKRIEIIRPFITISRQQVLAYAKINKLTFVNDETNFDDKYTRNWVRSKLIPMLEKKQPKIKEHLFLMSKDLAHYIKAGEKDAP